MIEATKFDKRVSPEVALALIEPKKFTERNDGDIVIESSECLADALKIRIMYKKVGTDIWAELACEHYPSLKKYVDTKGVDKVFELQYPEIVTL